MQNTFVFGVRRQKRQHLLLMTIPGVMLTMEILYHFSIDDYFHIKYNMCSKNKSGEIKMYV